MQVILGANGVVGRDLARRLPAWADRVRQVARPPTRINDGDELVAADVAYLLAGLTGRHRPDAWGQVWHALTSKEPITGEQYVRLACELAGRPYGLQVAPRWMLRLMGLFVPVLRENMEMMYQFEHDYRFDSTKAERALGLAASSYRDGIAATLRS